MYLVRVNFLVLLLATLSSVDPIASLAANRANVNTFVVSARNDDTNKNETNLISKQKLEALPITYSQPQLVQRPWHSSHDQLPDLDGAFESHTRNRAILYSQGNARMTKYKRKSSTALRSWQTHQPGNKTFARKLNCYYTVPRYDDRPFPVFPEQIDPHLCTHIIVGFARVENHTIAPSDGRDFEFYNRTLALKRRNADLKVMLVVGGGGGQSSFADMISSNATRLRFLESCDRLLQQYLFDGLDFDWEFPAWQGKIEEKIQFMSFLRETRAFFAQKRDSFLLSTAVPASQPIIDVGYNVAKLAETVDFIHLMTYDFHFFTPVTPFTGPNAPLKGTANDIGLLKTMNTEWAVKYWYQNGMPAHKILVGIPAYGHTFRLVDERERGYYALANGIGSVGVNGFVNYPEICNFLTKNGTTVVFDRDTEVPYASNGEEWISFDNEESGKRKAEWIRDNGFGGAMIWCINADDAWKVCKSSRELFPIINAVRSVLLPKVPDTENLLDSDK